jgi:hypothetical protein
MLKLQTRADLQRLIDDEIQESLTLDYKHSPALAKDDRARDELCKDVSAFANSAGGQIIYGIPEKNQKPQPLDSGVPNDKITREWIEQVINSRVQPRIEGLVITPIPFDSSHTGYVITIPQSSARAPHQAPDKKYYKRQNFHSVPMEDYEIRDTLRRATTPDLLATLALASESQTLVYQHMNEISLPVGLIVRVGNRSNQPAFYVVVRVGLDSELALRAPGHFQQAGTCTEQGVHFHWLERRMSSPPELPLFKEADPWQGTFTFGVRSSQAGASEFWLTTVVQSPGFEDKQCWTLIARGGTLTLQGPFAKFP